MKSNSIYKKDKMPEKNRPELDWWNELTEEEKTAIEIGLEDVKEGRIVPQTEVKKNYAKWL